ncbi:hypothetical protein HT031_000992 [Scenedesmus sp. PABB004]|nr:hypothetical protein HT031_000992 [Scenedesmus sp. PABB004]
MLARQQRPPAAAAAGAACTQRRGLTRVPRREAKLTRISRSAGAVTSSDGSSLRAELLASLGGSWGAAPPGNAQRQRVLDIVAALKQEQQRRPHEPPPTAGPLGGEWRLLWTTEESVHSIVRGPLPVADIRQAIDLAGKRVTNTISWGVAGLQLQAAGPLTVLSATRIAYSFDALRVGVGPLRLALPAVIRGGGWTDVVVLDDGGLRVMENSRRDTLVLQRVGRARAALGAAPRAAAMRAPACCWLALALALVAGGSGARGAVVAEQSALGLDASATASFLPLFGSKTLPFVQPGCHMMFRPGAWCLPVPSPFVKGCCTPGHTCVDDAASITGHTCVPVEAGELEYSYDEAKTGNCSARVPVGGQCGGAGFDCYKHGTCDQFGPWRGFCCPNGYSCQPYSNTFRKWLCQVDVQDQPPVDAEKEILQYPPRPMPAGACTCRHGWNKERVPMECPSPWASPAGTSKVRARTAAVGGARAARALRVYAGALRAARRAAQVPPPLALAPGGLLLEQPSGTPAVLRGVNWFGWSVGSFNFDGQWAFCDDNTTYSNPPCKQDGDIPPYVSAYGKAGRRTAPRAAPQQRPAARPRRRAPAAAAHAAAVAGTARRQGNPSGGEYSPAVGEAGQRALNISYWGKRRMTNDFAAVVYRTKLLGFNAIRVQFKFSDLNLDLPPSASEFFPCLLDSDEYIGIEKTMDPELIAGLGPNWSLEALAPYLPKYKGMPHPPPPTGNPQCDRPWSAPFLANYTGGRGASLNLTQCNWYLPQGPGVPALYRFLWQLQYLVSQGFYLLLDFSSSRDAEPNVSNPEVLAANWGNFWRILTDIPAYDTHLRGRVRWGCQWQDSCHEVNGTKACAPVLQSYGMAAAAIWAADPDVPIFINGLGQDNSTKWDQCGNFYPGMHWGDGFITNKRTLDAYALSDPSDMFTTAFTQKLGPVRVEHGDAQMSRLVLSPHIYPGTITGDPNFLAASVSAITYRWDLSWGWKMQGLDSTSSGARIPALPVVIGESGAKDWGDNSVNNTDTTHYTDADKMWLNVVASYLRALSEKTGRQPSWFWWALNANSGDTKGLLGPSTTWREVQWTKVRVLIRIYGLRPWFCGYWSDFCADVEW